MSEAHRRRFEDEARRAISAHPLVWTPEADLAVRTVCDRGGVVLLGELHGIAENASLVLSVLERFEIRALALEWYPWHREAIDRFAAHGRLDLAAFEGSGDGRVTPQHFALLRALLRGGHVSDLLLVDDATFDDGLGHAQNRRERWMASALLGAWPRQGPVLFVAGSLHARRRPIVLDGSPAVARFGDVGEEAIVPTGACIAAAVGDCVSLWPLWRSGGYWNFGLHAGAPALPPGPGSASTVGDDDVVGWSEGDVLIDLPVSTPALVPSPHERLP